MHLLEVLQIVARFDGDLARRVGLVALEVEVEGYLLDASLLHELDVDEMRLGAVGLPESVGVVITQLLDPIAGFGGAESPDGVDSDFPALVVVGGRGGGERVRG